MSTGLCIALGLAIAVVVFWGLWPVVVHARQLDQEDRALRPLTHAQCDIQALAPGPPRAAWATEGERRVVEATVEVWNAYARLEQKEGISHPMHGRDVADGIHAVQRVIAMRVARRVDPDLWRPST